MPASNIVQPFEYSDPSPFSLPTTQQKRKTVFDGALDFLNDLLPPDFIRRESLHIDSVTLEEIMTNITEENNARGRTAILWRTYKTSGSGWVAKSTFTNPNVNGTHLAGQAMEVFPLIVSQIQTEIETLLSDTNFPDSLGRHLGRIMANNTTVNGSSKFNNVTKLPDSVTVHIPSGTTTINPLALAQAGGWAFPASLVGQMVPVMGVSAVDPTVQNVNVATVHGGSQIVATDPNFPQSPYGASASGIPGVDVPMTAENRAVFNRVQTDSLSGADIVDPDMGYGYLTGHALMIEQLRYQPPQIETFPNTRSVRDYASNITSNTTPNLPWVLSLPVETQIVQNWGNWLIKGNAGVTAGGAFIRAYNNPSASEGAKTFCPFAVFFPPSTVNCSCLTADESYFIWSRTTEGAGDLPLVWNNLSLSQTSRGKKKKFGRHTRLIVEASLSGQSSPNANFTVAIRTDRIGTIQDQPFITIISSASGTGFDVNIMDRLAAATAYTPGGLDAILAIRISVSTSDQKNAPCDTEDEPGGTIVPESCQSIVSCSAGDFSATVRRLRIEDPALVGDPVTAYQ